MASNNAVKSDEQVETGQIDQSASADALPAGSAATGAKKIRSRVRSGKGGAASKVSTGKAGSSKAPATSKTETVIRMLNGGKGATVAAMMEATGWQAHSVRGFLSGTVKKKMGLAISSEAGKDGVRRYRVQDLAKAG